MEPKTFFQLFQVFILIVFVKYIFSNVLEKVLSDFSISYSNTVDPSRTALFRHKMHAACQNYPLLPACPLTITET